MAFKVSYPYKFSKEANSWLRLSHLVRMYRLKRKKSQEEAKRWQEVSEEKASYYTSLETHIKAPYLTKDRMRETSP